MPKKEVHKRDIIGEQIEAVIAMNRGTSGVIGRIANAAKALNQRQVKAALMMTDREELDKEHQIVVGVAKKCVAEKENCPTFCKEGAQQLLTRVTSPDDDTSLEGLEEYMNAMPQGASKEEAAEPLKAEPPPPMVKPKEEMTDEELYENCEVCHVSAAAAAAADICEEHPQEICNIISQRLDKEDVEPEDWIRALLEAAAKSEGEAKAKLDASNADLKSYFERRNSPFLKIWEETITKD